MFTILLEAQLRGISFVLANRFSTFSIIVFYIDKTKVCTDFSHSLQVALYQIAI